MLIWMEGGWNNKVGSELRPACMHASQEWQVLSVLCIEARTNQFERGCSKLPSLKATDQVFSTWGISSDDGQLGKTASIIV